MPLPEVVAALDRVLALSARTAAALEAAGECAGEMLALVERAAEGTAGDELERLRAEGAAFAEGLAEVGAALAGGRESVESYRATLTALLAPMRPPVALATGLVEPLVAGTGDTYPPGTEWALPLITHRHSPERSGLPVEGHVRALDPESQISHAFRPSGGRWRDEAEERLRALNAPDWALNVVSHVEVQVAAWMIACRIRRAELVLNREPCGIRVRRGCHGALSALLPPGYRLTVAGTCGGGGHYRIDYDGRTP
ncbi:MULTISPECIES: DddA-like double-stranded DNA deaminase toxin [Actinosynnema]|uniref:DddA-like double-stranded DNA deaminase toxin n=1 Tax=Actinosynnema TaxID=40566 RepID=UPI0020A576DA|nr:DddA-like double-stranded DNA deaminase toxin [Actinosynnema pretiosum]MCP2097214.1 SCP1.201-like deaminase [Actinosynnema pretiosum]